MTPAQRSHQPGWYENPDGWPGSERWWTDWSDKTWTALDVPVRLPGHWGNVEPFPPGRTAARRRRGWSRWPVLLVPRAFLAASLAVMIYHSHAFYASGAVTGTPNCIMARDKMTGNYATIPHGFSAAQSTVQLATNSACKARGNGVDNLALAGAVLAGVALAGDIALLVWPRTTMTDVTRALLRHRVVAR